MENDLKGNENYFELTGGSSYGGFELPGVDCIFYYCWGKENRFVIPRTSGVSFYRDSTVK